MAIEIRSAVSRREYERMTTCELRTAFLVNRLFTPCEINLVYWETDRTVVGSATPINEPLRLEADRKLAAEFFCERRELGVINIGGAVTVTGDGARYALGAVGCLYVGRGSREVIFASDDPAQRAKFYLVSYPAHVAHPTTLARPVDANQVGLGAPETANQRTIFQYIHEAGIRSCQLVMGFTQLVSRSVWNTMPPHTHARRSEVYLYFDLPADAAVFHFMGPGDETR